MKVGLAMAAAMVMVPRLTVAVGMLPMVLAGERATMLIILATVAVFGPLAHSPCANPAILHAGSIGIREPTAPNQSHNSQLEALARLPRNKRFNRSCRGRS